jgi:ribosomal protein L11 methyltransferase
MMNDTWIQLEICVPAPAIDLVCAELSALGCTGTLVEKRTLDSFVVPDEDFDPASDVALQAYFSASVVLDELRPQIYALFERLRPVFPGRMFTLGQSQIVCQEDWAEGWKQHFHTMHIGKNLVVHPSWETYQARQHEKIVVLDPGMAFGTGSHGTTLLCLQAIAAQFETSCPPQSLLDVGTGSGILAIAAARLGATRVVACDIDPLACQVARENCVQNAVAHQVEITSAALDQIPGQFDLVVANILAEENSRLAADLCAHLSPGGQLLLSGILAEKEALVLEGFSALPLDYLSTAGCDEWVCLHLVKQRP